MAESNGSCCEIVDVLNSIEDMSNYAQTITPNDVTAFLTYCQLWQHKHCGCIYSNDDLIEKFHQLINSWIQISIEVIHNYIDDNEVLKQSSTTTNDTATIDQQQQQQQKLNELNGCVARKWSNDNKEKLLLAIVKIFSATMPLYVTYKQYFINNKDICDAETMSLLTYCQNQQDNDMPVDLLRNICNFIESNGMNAIKTCFSKATPDTLPISIAHLLFNIIHNIRLWLIPQIVIHHITGMRCQVIQYMCQLSDKDLRLAGTKNTTDLMYNSFKDTNDTNEFRLDTDGLTLAYKYFMCSTLTIRLCGLAQMNSQISLWNALNTNTVNPKNFHTELSEWFIENKIIEHLFGPNLHIEVIKRSQDIMNFLAFTNKITNKHLDLIWASGQLKHCSKVVLDMLLVLHKNLYPEPLKYLIKLIFEMDTSAHTEQTIVLSAYLTKHLWSTLLSNEYLTHHSNSSNHTATAATSSGSVSSIGPDVSGQQKTSLGPVDSIVFQPSVQQQQQQQDIFSSNGSAEEDLMSSSGNRLPSKLNKRHNESMETQPQSGDDVEPSTSNTQVTTKLVKKQRQTNVIISQKQHVQQQQAQQQQHQKSNRLNQRLTANRIQKHNNNLNKRRKQLENAKLLNKTSNKLTESSKGGSDEKFVIPVVSNNMAITTTDTEDEDDDDVTTDEEIISMSNINVTKTGVKHKLSTNESESEEIYSVDEGAPPPPPPGLIRPARDSDDEEDDDEEEEDEDESESSSDKNNKFYVNDLGERKYKIKKTRTNGSKKIKVKEITRTVKTKQNKSEIVELVKVKASKNSMNLASGKSQEKIEIDSQQSNDSITNSQNSLNTEMEAEIYDCAQNYARKALQVQNNDASSDVSKASPKNLDEFDEENEDSENDGEEIDEGVDEEDEDDDEEDEDDEEEEEEEEEEEDDDEDDEEDEEDDDEEEYMNLQNTINRSRKKRGINVGSTSSSSNNKTINTSNSSTSNENTLININQSPPNKSKRRLFNINDVCVQGNTFLWDLLQDDKVVHLNEKLMREAEKQLYALVCYQTDKKIRIKFIEGCINNLKNNRSSIISLRLLSKILSSFQTCRGIAYNNDIFKMIQWANNEHSLMKVFFDNLKQFKLNYTNKSKQIVNIQTEIQVRLNFLTHIFSIISSPKDFELNDEQTDTLWDCLIVIEECKDELFQWLLNQAKNKDQHAIHIHTFKNLFMNKIPLLDPHTFSPIALHLYQELFKMYKLIYHNKESFKQEIETTAIEYMGKLAFKCLNADVSVAAIQFLNQHYVQSDCITVEQEQEFINRCMFYLNDAINCLYTDTYTSIMVLQRGLLLLKNHLELFMRRFSYQLRISYLNSASVTNESIISHIKSLQESSNCTNTQLNQITFICCVDLSHLTSSNMTAAAAAIHSHRFTIKVNTNVYIGELKATIKQFIKLNLPTIIQQIRQQTTNETSSTFNEDDYSIRLSINSQDLTSTYYSKTIYELQIKDMQIIHITIKNQSQTSASRKHTQAGSSTSSTSSTCSTTSSTSSSSTTHISNSAILTNDLRLVSNLVPMLILSKEPHFSNLFHILNVISTFNKQKATSLSAVSTQNNLNDACLEMDTHHLASKIWEVIMLLPTNRNLINKFLQPNTINWHDDIILMTNSYKLLYYLQIIDILSRCFNTNDDDLMMSASNAGVGSLSMMELNALKRSILNGCTNKIVNWKKTFLESNCLFNIYKLLIDKMKLNLLTSENEIRKNELLLLYLYDDAYLDCLSFILKLLTFYLIDHQQISTTVSAATSQASTSSSSTSPILNVLNNDHFSIIPITPPPSTTPQSSLSSNLIAPPPNVTISAASTSREQLQETPRKKAKRNNNNNNNSSSNTPATATPVMNQASTTSTTSSTSSQRSCIIDLISTPLPKLRHNLANNLLLNDIDTFLNIIFNLQMLISTPTNEQMFIFNNAKNNAKIDILNNSMQLLSACLVIISVDPQQELNEMIKEKFCSSTMKQQRVLWLKALILDSKEGLLRKEVCNWLYRICVLSGVTTSNQHSQITTISSTSPQTTSTTTTTNNILLIILSDLLSLLAIAIKLNTGFTLTNKNKEQYYFNLTNTSSCKDYFFLLTTLIQHLNYENNDKQNINDPIGIDNLMRFIQCQLKERDYYEMTNVNNEDEILIGLLNLGIAIMKHNPSFKSNQDASKSFIKELYGYLFELPTSEKRYLPKCKSISSRSLCFDLLVELVHGNGDNYKYLHEILMKQHQSKTHSPYPWEYWPRDDVRSACGYVGLTNLGATCYLATCMQHLYMIREARYSLLKAKVSDDGRRYESMLTELQKMFAYLLESERKAYNPKNFCKAYTMDNQPLNTTEQKDMTEFFNDLISKIEDMSPELKQMVKTLFGGVTVNSVISLDCTHISKTLEEFYTVRCTVAGTKDLYDSLNALINKEALEGDNMYTCSKCGKKVRAERRACFRKLPKIICFNTMRYTFNVNTMLKEKVNTHFSFPLQLDMSGYMEKNLITPNVTNNNSDEQTNEEEGEEQQIDDEQTSYMYELIGVTVHTGTAEGGHYYSFIRDRSSKDDNGQDRWYLFNDAEVKQFDPSQLPAECFGGETTSKTYDSSADRFMDLSYEKTHSAYMLFYERIPKQQPTIAIIEQEDQQEQQQIPKELTNWIWEDNMKFIQDRNTFENSYFNFIWQMCDYIPRSLYTTLTAQHSIDEYNLLATKLGCSFILETYIHSKEKATMLKWIELLNKYFISNKLACKWFLEYMCEDLSWPAKVFLKCPNSTMRQFIYRLLLHVINRIKLFNNELPQQNDKSVSQGSSSTSKIVFSNDEDREFIERFIKKLLELIDLSNINNQIVKLIVNNKYNIRYMCEYFIFLHEFLRAGSDECSILIKSGAISKCIRFYLIKRNRSLNSSNAESLLNLNNSISCVAGTSGSTSAVNVETSKVEEGVTTTANEAQITTNSTNTPTTTTTTNTPMAKQQSLSHLFISSGSDDETSDIIPIQDHKPKVKVFEKIITLVSLLVENVDSVSNLSIEDQSALIGENEELTFFYKAILDDINLHHLRNIIYCVVRAQPLVAHKLIDMIANAIKRLHNDNYTPFLNMLGNQTMGILEYECNDGIISSHSKQRVDYHNNLPDFTDIIIKKLPVIIESASSYVFLWLSSLVICNVRIHKWCIDNMRLWCKQYFIAHKQTPIRCIAGLLLARLVPNDLFRENYVHNRPTLTPFKNPHHASSSSSILGHASTSTSTSGASNDDSMATTSSNQPTYSLNMDINSPECKQILHKIIEHLLQYMPDLINYVDRDQHANNNRLVQYFSFLIYCMISKEEKLLFKQHICQFWSSFYPLISNTHTVSNINKHLTLQFLYITLNSCQENILYLLSKPKIETELPMVTISVDHEDSELVQYNRNCLHIYYGIIRLCCQYSREYARKMSTHNNFTWAFKHILPYSIQYQSAAQELLKCINLFIDKSDIPTASALSECQQYIKQIASFKENLLNIYLHEIDTKQCWQSIITVLRIVNETVTDTYMILQKKGLTVLTSSFLSIFNMHVEATACNLVHDLIDCMSVIIKILDVAKNIDQHIINDVIIKQHTTNAIQQWKEKAELCRRLIVLLNFYNTLEVRLKALDLLELIIQLSPNDTLEVVVQAILSSNLTQNSIGSYTCAYYLSNSSKQQLHQHLHHQHHHHHHTEGGGGGSVFMPTSSYARQIQSPSSQQFAYMGPYFPISKILPNTLNNMNTSSSSMIDQRQFEVQTNYHYYTPSSFQSANLLRPTKPSFNLFLKQTNVSHTHLSGCIYLIDQEYEILLNENFGPYFKFIESIFRVAIMQQHQASLVNQDLFNLLLIVSQQALLLNINIISELYDLIMNSNETIRSYLFKSPFLLGYIQTILIDNRHAINKHGMYELIQQALVLQNPQEIVVKIDIKVIIEECYKSVRAIKDYLDQIMIDNYCLMLNSTSIHQHVDYKLKLLMANTKLIYLIISLFGNNQLVISESSHNQIMLFLNEISEYLRNKIHEIRYFMTSISAQQSSSNNSSEAVAAAAACTSGSTAGQLSETTEDKAVAASTSSNENQQIKKPKWEQQHQQLTQKQYKFLDNVRQLLFVSTDFIGKTIEAYTNILTQTSQQQQQQQVSSQSPKPPNHQE